MGHATMKDTVRTEDSKRFANCSFIVFDVLQPMARINFLDTAIVPRPGENVKIDTHITAVIVVHINETLHRFFAASKIQFHRAFLV